MGTKLSIEIRNTKPVEVVDLTRALAAVADQYRMETAEYPGVSDSDVKLYVQQIRAGSIIIDVAPLALTAIQAAGGMNAVVTFAKNLRDGFNYLLGKDEKKPQHLNSRKSLTNYGNILDSVVKDGGSQIIFSPTFNDKVEFNFTLSSVDANAVQNRVSRELEALKEPQTGLHEKVLLYWYQTRNDSTSKVGDKAIIESIGKQPVRTMFLGESLKVQMLNMEENFYRRAFVVDVMVETVMGRPSLYKIQAIHDTVELEDQPGQTS